MLPTLIMFFNLWLKPGRFELTMHLKEKDVVSLAEDWKKRTIQNGLIVFGFAQAKILQRLMHWVQDMQRTQNDPAKRLKCT